MLFRLDPDFSHDVSQWFFRRKLLWNLTSPLYSYEHPSLASTLLNFELRNPIGLAAGFDKNGDVAPSMMALGFGFVTIGTVMREPREGNPNPRTTRRIPERALVNAMGLPSKGMNTVGRTLGRLRRKRPVVVNIGGHSTDDYCTVMERVSDFADAIEINISCPNVERGTEFAEDPDLFIELAKQLASRRKKPILVKIPPYRASEDEKLREIISMAVRAGFEGISATNTRKVDEPKISVKRGGLSGRPLFEETMRIVGRVYEETDGKMAIVGTGGVFEPRDVFTLIAQGASAIAFYTGLIYEGPGLAAKLKRGLTSLLRERGFSSLDELRGSALRK
jgi:dihydroorotate dehydrogenase subfamily 2